MLVIVDQSFRKARLGNWPNWVHVSARRRLAVYHITCTITVLNTPVHLIHAPFSSHPGQQHVK